MTLQHLLLILRARWKTILFLMSLIIICAGAISQLLPKTYTATASIVVDVRSPDPLLGATMSGQMIPGYMASQVDIIESPRVAREVVGLLEMDQSPDIQQQWREATEGEGTLIIWVAEQLRKKLEVAPSRESNVISISFSASDPEFAAVVANAFAEAYIETNLELKVEPAKRYAKWFDGRVSLMRDKLESAQKRLSSYQQENGIIATDARLDIEIARLVEQSSQLVAAESRSVESASRWNQSDNTSESMPEVLQNPHIASLKAEVGRQQATVSQLASRLGVSHPEYINAQAQLQGLQRQLDTEIKRVLSSIGTMNRVNNQRQADIAAQVEAQKARVLALRSQRDEIAVLQRDVESAQRAYDLVLERLTQADLESQTQQTNIAVLTPAIPPLKHSSPRILLNIVVAAFLGLLLGVGMALLKELLDQRVRSAYDLAQSTGIPVLGFIGGKGRYGDFYS